MERADINPALADTTWKFCGVALFQLGLLAGLSLIDDTPGAGFDIPLLVSLVVPILGVFAVNRTRSRLLAATLMAFLLARFFWWLNDADELDAPILYMQEVSDLLLAMLAFKMARVTWAIGRRDRIVAKMLGRLA